MEQLEARFYTRAEIAQITGTHLEDTKHFKRNNENILTKWGYGYDWMRDGVRITHTPTTSEERLQEILIRQFHVDIQVDMYSFACFVTAFTDIPGFKSMPWSVREYKFYYYSGKFVTSRTLSKWCKTLIEQNIMSRGTVGSYWKTYFVNNQKIRAIVSEAEAKEYFKRRSELLHKYIEENKQQGMDYDTAYKEAWKPLYQDLWAEYGCCYFSCKTFHFSAWNEQGMLYEVYELTREISRKEDGIGYIR